MEIDVELQNLINEYVKQVESKEGDLVVLKRNIDDIIFVAKKELNKVTKEFDKKFEANEINEDGYLKKFRVEKQNVLDKTKEKLNKLTDNLA